LNTWLIFESCFTMNTLLNPPMARQLATATWLVAALLAPHAAWSAPSAMGCLIEPERTADVGSPVIGVIDSIEVDRGDTVKKGQVLATLRAGVERANLDVASSRANSDAEYQAAAASAKFNRQRLVRAEDLFTKQFISQQALDQTRTEARLADHKLNQASDQRAVSQQERIVAEAQLSQRVIRSPMDGVVAERYASAGERVDDKPLLRIARVDPLRVQLVVPMSMYGSVQTNGRASVLPDLPGAVAKLARVTMVDKVVDAASNTFRVQLELPNADLSLPAGLRCKAEFTASANAPAAGNAPANAPSTTPAVSPPPSAVLPASVRVPARRPVAVSGRSRPRCNAALALPTPLLT
jgi:RND family efflux transporter MFP subunit